MSYTSVYNTNLPHGLSVKRKPLPKKQIKIKYVKIFRFIQFWWYPPLGSACRLYFVFVFLAWLSVFLSFFLFPCHYPFFFYCPTDRPTFKGERAMGNETLYWDDLIWLSVDAKPIGRKSCVFKSILLSVDVALVAGLRAYSLHKYIMMRILAIPRDL